MNEIAKTKFELLDVIETGAIKLKLAKAVLSEVIENYFCCTNQYEYLPLYADQINDLLIVLETLLHENLTELTKAVEDARPKKEASHGT